MNQEIACAVLEQAGYAVDAVASDGPSAVEAVRTGGYQLVLMDVQMPGMTGVDATRRIRALPEPMRSVPVIAMTANVLPDQVSGYKRASMNDHVGKPVDREQLYAAVDGWLQEPAQAPDGCRAAGRRSAGRAVLRRRGLPAACRTAGRGKDRRLPGQAARRDAGRLRPGAGIARCHPAVEGRGAHHGVAGGNAGLCPAVAGVPAPGRGVRQGR